MLHKGVSLISINIAVRQTFKRKTMCGEMYFSFELFSKVIPIAIATMFLCVSKNLRIKNILTVNYK